MSFAFSINFCSLSLFDYFSYFRYFVSRYGRLKFSYIFVLFYHMPFSYFYCVPRRRNTFTAFYCYSYRFSRLSSLSFIKKILVDSLLAITIINKTQRQQNVVLLWNHVSNSKYNHKKIRILAIGKSCSSSCLSTRLNTGNG